jgi:hypothetical protein
MTQDYVLGSLQGGILQPIQQHTWDVTFAETAPNNTLFTLHPYVSARELAMFFPEELKFLAGEVDRYHLVYTSPEKWNSSSPYEQAFQLRNDIILLYNIREGERQAHIDGFFPKMLDERLEDQSGWIFCRRGTVYIAFFPLKPYEWIEEKVNWRWRSHELKNGVVVEIGSAGSDGSFAAFRERTRSRRPAFPDFEKNLTVEFRTSTGDLMKFTYDGSRTVNGQAIDFKSYKLFNGPFMRAEVGTGVIAMTAMGKTRILDFTVPSITEK